MTVDYDGVIIGGTIQARIVAAQAAQQGARIALIEAPGEVHGQIQRQVLLEVLARYSANRQQHFFPNRPAPITQNDWSALKQRVAFAGDMAYPHLALDALTISGVDVVLESGQFTPKPRLAVTTDSRRLRGRGYFLSPPSRVTVPTIPGLAGTPVLTPDTLLDLESPPKQLAILGRSADAIALAQSLALLGIETTLMTRGEQLLPTEDPDISQFVASLLMAAGVDLRLNAQLEAVSHEGDFVIHCSDGDMLKVSQLLIATSRQPQLHDLNLKRINLQASPAAIVVDDQLRTSRPRCFAFGPCLGGYWADHTDDLDGQVALQNALYLPWRTLQQLNRVSRIPTLPGFARFGMTAQQALKYYGDAALVIQIPDEQTSKFHLDNRMTGMGRCIIHRNGSVLGAQIVAANAGDLAQTLALLRRRCISIQHVNQAHTLSMTDMEVLERLNHAWQQMRWQPGCWRRNWAENWFNWRRSRLRN
jgi:pyruvate/2-oxoglutarate dehydrogenase complex dihydrolipoamide dehydrogenase (E3) component